MIKKVKNHDAEKAAKMAYNQGKLRNYRIMIRVLFICWGKRFSENA